MNILSMDEAVVLLLLRDSIVEIAYVIYQVNSQKNEFNQNKLVFCRKNVNNGLKNMHVYAILTYHGYLYPVLNEMSNRYIRRAVAEKNRLSDCRLILSANPVNNFLIGNSCNGYIEKSYINIFLEVM